MRAPRLAAATVLAVLAAALAGASSAHADVKVPKALAGVALHEGATKVEVDRKVKRLVDACADLAQLYRTGRATCPEDDSCADVLFLMACKGGDEPSCVP